MTRHFNFRPQFTGTVIAALIAAQALHGQEIPPPPPQPVQIAAMPDDELPSAAAEPLTPADTAPTAPVLPDAAARVTPAGANNPVPAPMAPVPAPADPNLLPVPAVAQGAEPTPVDSMPADLPQADPTKEVPEDDVDVQARGPVHEAFADVYDLNPVQSELVDKAPPAAVQELPPDQAPEGANVQWIPGYWAWDLEAKDYMWVSGVWRDVPPGRRWVPGYWAEITGGYQWVSGFWADAKTQELAYLPQPPQSLDTGPNVPAPNNDSVWVPGSWTYVNNSYSWTPGSYMTCQPNYMWVPNQYMWTPSGYVYVPGYWDYRFANRGVCFSPVRFRRPLYGYGWGTAWYRPRYSYGMSGFLIHLFVRPRCRSYWYGNYYGGMYAGFGFTPWYRRTSVYRHSYDPAFNFYRWDGNRHGQNFVNNIHTWHQRYETNPGLRPPTHVRDFQNYTASHHGDRAAQLGLTTHRYSDLTNGQGGQNGQRFHHIDSTGMNTVRANHQVNHALEVSRHQAEVGHRHGSVVSLKPGADQPGHLADRNGGGATNHLKLHDLPAALHDRTQQSIQHADQLRQHAHNGGVAGRDALNGVGGGNNAAAHSAHPNIDALHQRLQDRQSVRDHGQTGVQQGHNAHLGNAAANGNGPSVNHESRLNQLHQRAEAHRVSNGSSFGGGAGNPQVMSHQSNGSVVHQQHQAQIQQHQSQVQQRQMQHQQHQAQQYHVPQVQNHVQHQMHVPQHQMHVQPQHHVQQHFSAPQTHHFSGGHVGGGHSGGGGGAHHGGGHRR